MFVLIKRQYLDADEGDGSWSETRVALFPTAGEAALYEKAARNTPPIITKDDVSFSLWTRERKYRTGTLLSGADDYRIEAEEELPRNPSVKKASDRETVSYFTAVERPDPHGYTDTYSLSLVAVMQDGSRQQSPNFSSRAHAEHMNKYYGLSDQSEKAE